MKSFIAFFSSSLFSGIVQLFSTIIVGRNILSYEIGSVYSSSVYFPIFPLLLLGINNGANIILPLVDNKKEHNSLFNSVLSFSFIISTLSFLLNFLICFIIEGKELVYVTVNSIFLFFFILNPIVEMYFSSSFQFTTLSKYRFIKSLLSLLFVIPILYFGIEAFLFRYVMVPMIYFILLYRSISFRFYFDFGDLLKLSRKGLFIALSSILIGILWGLDRYFLDKNWTQEEFGMFYIAYAVGQGVMLVVVPITQYCHPYLIRHFSNEVVGRIDKKKLILALTVVFLLGLTFFTIYMLPIIVSLILPDYSEGIYAAQIMMFVMLTRISLVVVDISFLRLSGWRVNLVIFLTLLVAYVFMSGVTFAPNLLILQGASTLLLSSLLSFLVFRKYGTKTRV